MHLTKEEQILLQHYNDMIQLSYQRSIPVYSQFSSLTELELAYQALDEFYGHYVSEGVQYKLFGGYSEAERKIICFLPEQNNISVCEQDFPIRCVRIAPANRRFCDMLNHRDYLGTIMNLGITRDQIGDILVKKEEQGTNQVCVGYIFCKKDKADLLLGINRIKHTTVVAGTVELDEIEWTTEFKEITGSVSSFRLDAIVALAARLSRSKVLELVQNGKVFLNGRCCTENAKKLNEGDIFTIRGYGKFLFYKANSISRKGRYQITVKQYI